MKVRDVKTSVRAGWRKLKKVMPVQERLGLKGYSKPFCLFIYLFVFSVFETGSLYPALAVLYRKPFKASWLAFPVLWGVEGVVWFGHSTMDGLMNGRPW